MIKKKFLDNEVKKLAKSLDDEENVNQ